MGRWPRDYSGWRAVLYLCIISCAINLPVSLYRAFESFHDPHNYWIHADQWYDHLLQAVWGLIAGISCVAYDRRRTRFEAESAIDPSPVRRQHWDGTIEFRFALSCLLGISLIQFLFNVRKSYMATYVIPWHDGTLWSNLNMEPLVYTTFAAASLVYLQWWSKRRKRDSFGYCLQCGYDLRASKERCPECGTPIQPGSTVKPMT